MATEVEDIAAEVADKYEHKRDGLTIDEALEASVLGYRVTCDLLQAGSYIHYVFNGWRHEFSHAGQIGSSSAWKPGDPYSAVVWRIFDLKPPQLDSWGRPVAILESNPGDPAWVRNKWGQSE
jgi:hypothetical protein